MDVINQKEYLKKYLSGKKDKKKKKRRKDVSDRMKIIDPDDDADLSNSITADNEDLYGPNEDAPQIVGVIDDRPMHMRIDDYRKSNKWRPMGAAEDPEVENVVTKSDREIVMTFFKNESRGVENKRTHKSFKKVKVESKGSGESRWDMKSRERTLGDTPPRKESESDISPPRKPSSPRDISPPRRRRRDSDKDQSPPRLRQKDCDNSPPRKRDRVRKDPSPPRRKLLPGDKKGKYLIPAKRMDKTLDGKKAGLQNARELVQENQEFRKREDALFKQMSSETSGVNAATVVRDRKTGKVRDPEKEAQERLEKEKRDEANKEKYMRWGKGLKQVEDYETKLQDAVNEMNKPFARYADDEDLERHLKEQEREGDPMLDYIRKKRRKKDVDTGKPVKQQFEGEFMPNRFGIRPGQRWDGVDRSNGYEKKWIDVQNTRHAIQEEVYKWSTEDM